MKVNWKRQIQEIKSDVGRLVFLGGNCCCGRYVLKICVKQRIEIAFGRFRRGKIIEVVPGWYSYVGSALAMKGPGCLARRIVRHATRFGGGPPHYIRSLMLEQFLLRGLGCGNLVPENGKHALWNVDHLLNEPSVELTGAYLVQSPVRIEAALGKFLENDVSTFAFERGLGANDIKGNTHLLRVDADEQWWDRLPLKLSRFIGRLGV